MVFWKRGKPPWLHTQKYGILRNYHTALVYFQQVKIKSVKQFFGPVVTSVPEPIVEGDVTVTPPLSARDDDGEEIPIISFRLKGT